MNNDENFTIGEKILHIEQDNRVPISEHLKLIHNILLRCTIDVYKRNY